MTAASSRPKPKIAIFDYSVRSDSAMGGCHLRLLAGLADKYDFTVFAVEFENPDPLKIKFVRIPAYKRPTILLSVMFHLLAPIYYFIYRLKNRVSFDLVEKTEVFTFLGTVSYIHFCHRTYLGRYWNQSRQAGMRGLLLSLDHAVRAKILEPLIYRSARRLVVPSHGLARELAEAYPFTKNKIHVVPNPVDFWRLSRPDRDFDRLNFRRGLGFDPDDLVLAFAALGQFERKGLQILFEGLEQTNNPHVKILVVGGSEYWIKHYSEIADRMNIRQQINFVGMQRDVAPFLWAADAFCMPSLYETFLLVAIESAPAGLPIVVPHLNGVEDYLVDGENGILIERTPRSVAAAIQNLLCIGSSGRMELGSAAQRAARRFSLEAFVKNWDEFIAAELEKTS